MLKLVVRMTTPSFFANHFGWSQSPFTSLIKFSLQSNNSTAGSEMAGGVITHSSVNSGPPTEGSRMYAVIVCVFASLGGIFFGYDQGVTGGVLVMPSFLNDFCIDMNDKIVIHPNFTELNIYTVCKPKNTADLPDNWTNDNFQCWFLVLRWNDHAMLCARERAHHGSYCSYLSRHWCR